MKRNPLIVSLIGGGIALLCCLLPWIKIDISALDLDPVISPAKESLTISIITEDGFLTKEFRC